MPRRLLTLPKYLPLNPQHLSRGEAVAEMLEVLEGPDDFLVAGDFDELRDFRTGVAVAEDDVAVGENFQGSHPGERDAGKLIVLDAPDGLAFGGDLEDAVAVAGGDESVAAGKAQGVEDVVAVAFGAMAGRSRAAGKVELI